MSDVWQHILDQTQAVINTDDDVLLRGDVPIADEAQLRHLRHRAVHQRTTPMTPEAKVLFILLAMCPLLLGLSMMAIHWGFTLAIYL